MFSEKFAVQEKYSLLTQEHISTCQRMPVRFTSLRDERYGPPIDDAVKQKLNKWVEYLPQHVTDPMRDDTNDLFIEYKDDTLLSYFVCKNMRFSVVSDTNIWRGFLNKIDCSEVYGLRPQIRELCSLQQEGTTQINGIEYSADGTLSGLRIYDSRFNLTNYPFMKPVEDLTIEYEHGNRLANTSITLYPDGDKIKLNLNFFYSQFMNTNYKSEKTVPRMYTMYPEQVDMYLDTLGVNGENILTQEQVDFIKLKCVGDTFFHLTFVYDAEGTCQDIFMYHNTISEFKDLTVG
jgi:hypothetical protein